MPGTVAAMVTLEDMHMKLLSIRYKYADFSVFLRENYTPFVGSMQLGA